MGMFDYIHINVDMLPVPNKIKPVLDKCEFQTKSLFNQLIDVYIKDDCTIEYMEYHYENIPEEQRPFPNEPGIKGMFGSIRKVEDGLVASNHTGIIEFYTFAYEKWYEFSAKVVDGKVENIVKLK
jgi:hypothetical protein